MPAGARTFASEEKAGTPLSLSLSEPGKMAASAILGGFRRLHLPTILTDLPIRTAPRPPTNPLGNFRHTPPSRPGMGVVRSGTFGRFGIVRGRKATSQAGYLFQGALSVLLGSFWNPSTAFGSFRR
ncbi:hypothetical protein chiPu_0018785 [Chiloscyllium punctatum]|uniref:Uncharacterized protein n=1 Tax=Chiloscyllium punctatum TaxID=137246 RepID=A0A401RPV0_CHIPU|nr:hypothetical protein [Chiloscyllium punctatum]